MSDTDNDPALYVIYVYIRYAYNNNITENLVINNIINDEVVSEHIKTGNYAQAMEVFSEEMTSFRTKQTNDK